MQRHHVAIIGAGFGGIGMAIRLKQAGFHDFTLIEKDDGVGGTWRANRYPGAACDIESHLYSFSFEPNPRWSRTYAPQREILAYLEHCADAYGIRPHLREKTCVTSATFDERRGLWTLETTGGPVQARVVVFATGGLSRPSVPDMPGLETFAGKTFHSARWDHDFPLAGKTVAVIGTGASAIQYRTASGKNTTLWPGFTFEFRLRTRRFDAERYDLVPDRGEADRDVGRSRVEAGTRSVDSPA